MTGATALNFAVAASLRKRGPEEVNSTQGAPLGRGVTGGPEEVNSTLGAPLGRWVKVIPLFLSSSCSENCGGATGGRHFLNPRRGRTVGESRSLTSTASSTYLPPPSREDLPYLGYLRSLAMTLPSCFRAATMGVLNPAGYVYTPPGLQGLRSKLPPR